MELIILKFQILVERLYTLWSNLGFKTVDFKNFNRLPSWGLKFQLALQHRNFSDDLANFKIVYKGNTCFFITEPTKFVGPLETAV